MKPKQKRQLVLLRAAYDILTRCKNSSTVEDANAVLAHYDGTDCDGACLREDIAIFLDIPEDCPPIKLDQKEGA